MFSNIGKLLTTDLDIKDFYGFAIQVYRLITNSVGEDRLIEPYLEVTSRAINEMEKVFLRSSGSPLTQEINRKHHKRLNLLIALKRQIGAGQKIESSPQIVVAADNLRREFRARKWWKYEKYSYQHATSIIRPMLIKVQEESFVQWVEIVGVTNIIADLDQAQGEFEVLFNDRLAETHNVLTPKQGEARERLQGLILSLLDALDFGVSNFPETFTQIGHEVSKLITAINSITRTRKTSMDQSENIVPDNETNADSLNESSAISESSASMNESENRGAPAEESDIVGLSGVMTDE